MKIVRFLGGIAAAFAAIVCFYSFPTMLAEKVINPQIIDSGVDKLFFAFMVLGCGMCYAIASICLFKGWKLTEHKIALYGGMLSCFAFIAGLYYHMIFGSPW